MVKFLSSTTNLDYKKPFVTNYERLLGEKGADGKHTPENQAAAELYAIKRRNAVALAGQAGKRTDFSLTKTSSMTLNDWNLSAAVAQAEQVLASSLNLSKIKNHSGTTVTFDLETLGGFDAIAKQQGVALSDLERQMATVTEFSRETRTYEGGVVSNKKIETSIFGLSPKQMTYYEGLLEGLRDKPLADWSASDKALVERLTRYRGQDTFTVSGHSTPYKLANPKAPTFNLVDANEGLKNLGIVGRRQGLHTAYGRKNWNHIVEQLASADAVVGQNILQFDLPAIQQVATHSNTLNAPMIAANKVFDTLSAMRLASQGDAIGYKRTLALANNREYLPDAKNGLTLSGIAKQVGHAFLAHDGEHDTLFTGRLAHDIPHAPNTDLPVLAARRAEALLASNKAVNAISSNTVLVANRAIENNKHGFDSMMIDGQMVTSNDWVISKNFGYTVTNGGIKKITKKEAMRTLGEAAALDLFQDKEELFHLGLQGASPRNENIAVNLYRHSEDELINLMQNNFTTKTRVDSNRSVTEQPSLFVTQKILDRQVNEQYKDRARRVFLGAIQGDDTNNEYTRFKRMFDKYNSYKTQHAGNANVDNAIATLFEKGSHADKELFRDLFPFFESSHETLSGLYSQLDSEFSYEKIKAQNPSILDADIKTVQNKAKRDGFAAYFNHFELNTKSGAKTPRDLYSLTLNIKGSDAAEANFKTVDGGAKAIMNALRSGVAGGNLSDDMADVKMRRHFNEMADDLLARGLIDERTHASVTANERLYESSRTLSRHLHDGISQAVAGVSEDALLASPTTRKKALDKLVSSEDAFTRGYGQTLRQNDLGRLDVSNIKVRQAGGAGAYNGLDAYGRRAPKKQTAAMTGAMAQGHALNKNVINSNRSASRLMPNQRDLLKNYHFTDENINELERVIFGVNKDGKLGLATEFGMNVSLVESNGAVNVVAYQNAQQNKIQNLIRSNAPIEVFREGALVLPLPKLSTELGMKTIVQGTTHKGVPRKLDVRFDKRLMTGLADENFFGSAVVKEIDVVTEAIGNVFKVMGRAVNEFNDGQVIRANQRISSQINKGISKQPGLTSRQALTDTRTGRQIMGYLPNANDLNLNNQMSVAEMYSFMPFLYEKDETVRQAINDIFTREGDTANGAANYMNYVKRQLASGRPVTPTGGSHIALEEFFTTDSIAELNLMARLEKHGQSVFDENTLHTLHRFNTTAGKSAVIGESATQKNMISMVPTQGQAAYNVVNDATRPGINQAQNTLAIQLDLFKPDELRNIEANAGARPYARTMTHSQLAANQAVNKVAGNEGYGRVAHQLDATLKMASTEELLANLQTVSEQQKRAILQKFDGTYSGGDFDAVIRHFKRDLNTHEQRLVYHPALNTGHIQLPELTGFHATGVGEDTLESLVANESYVAPGQVIGYRPTNLDAHNKITAQIKSNEKIRARLERQIAGQTGEQLNVLRQQENAVLDKLMDLRRELNNVQEAVTYDKKVAGYVAGRSGSTIYVSPSVSATADAVKMSFAGEKGMASTIHVPGYKGKMKNLVDEIWNAVVGQGVTVTGNPEAGKHGVTAFSVDRYFSVPFRHIAGNAAAEKQFLAMANRYAPSWGFGISEYEGNRILTHTDIPQTTGGLIEELKQFAFGIQEHAKTDTRFTAAAKDLQRHINENLYTGPLALTTNSEQMHGATIKAQLRAQQVIGATDPSRYAQETNGVYRFYGEDITDWERKEAAKLVKGTAKSRYVKAMDVTTQYALGNGEAYGMSGQVKEIALDDIIVPRSGLSSELTQQTIFNVLNAEGSDTRGASGYYFDLDGFTVADPFSDTGARTSRMFIPNIDVHAIDGEVFFDDSARAVSDVLEAVMNVRNQTSSKPIEDALLALDDVYSSMYASFKTAISHNDGVLAKDIAQVRLTQSARGLGSKIEPFMPQALVNLQKEGESIAPYMNDLANDMRAGRLGVIELAKDDLYSQVISYTADGQLRVEDAVFASREQLEQMGFNAKVVGEQVQTRDFYDSDEAYERFQNTIKESGLTNLDDIGIMYAEEEGLYGVYGRNPHFKEGSRAAVKIYHDPAHNSRGHSFTIMQHMAGRFGQDTDGDTTDFTLFAEKNADGHFELVNQNTDLIQSTKKLMALKAEDNATIYLPDSIEGYHLDAASTGRVDAFGDDFAFYQDHFRSQGVEEVNSMLQDNMAKNDTVIARAVKNRHNKIAIGHLSAPNYAIREAAKSVFRMVGYEDDFDNIGHLTAVSEQDLISIKHVTGAIEHRTGSALYGKGVRGLMDATDEAGRIDAMEQIIRSFEGPIFKETLPSAADVIAGTINYGDFSDSDNAIIQGLMSLNKLSQTDGARGIFNNQFLSQQSTHTAKNRKDALKALKEGIATYGSERLSYFKDLISEEEDRTRLTIGSDVVGYNSDLRLMSDGLRAPLGAYAVSDGDIDVSGRYGATLTNEAGDSIRLYGESKASLEASIGEHFYPIAPDRVGEYTDRMENHFVRQFETAGVSSPSAYYRHSILAQTAATLHHTPDANVMDVIGHLAGEMYEGSDQRDINRMTASLRQEFSRYGNREIELLASLSDHYTSSQGQTIEEFADVLTELQSQNLISRSNASLALSDLNIAIREKGMEASVARQQALARRMETGGTTSQAVIDGWVEAGREKRLEAQRMGREMFQDFQTSRRTFVAPNIDDHADAVAALRMDYERNIPGFADLSSDQSSNIIRAAVSEAWEADATQANADMVERLRESMRAVYKNYGDDAFGWHSQQVLSGRELDADLFSDTLLFGDEFTGRRIRDVSLDDLIEFSTRPNVGDLTATGREMFSRSQQEVNAYLDNISNASADTYADAVSRQTIHSPRATIDADIPRFTTDYMNDYIREAASERTNATNDVKQQVLSDNIDAIRELHSGRARGGRMYATGVAMSAAAAMMMAGTQFSAKQDAINLARQSRDYEEEQGPATARVQLQAPASGYNGRSTYLQENASYKISAKAPKTRSAHLRQAENAIARTVNSDRFSVQVTDNREELSDRWLEGRIIDTMGGI